MRQPHRPTADLGTTWAIVPIRGLETAKTRLGGDLDAEERRDLVERMLRRTLEATRDAASIAGTIVVTMDPEAAGVATELRAIALVERAPGLNQAIRAASSLASARGATAVLVLPADLPRVGPDAVDDIVEASREVLQASGILAHPIDGLVAIVPDQHGSGTNALLLTPVDVIEPRFGAGSLIRHRGAAREAGATLLELDGPLSLDVDTAADLLVAESLERLHD